MASAWIVASVMVSILSVVASDPCVPPGEFLSGSSGVFSSPNFPNNFPPNSNCTWNITVPAGKIIKVTFFNFTLEPNQGSACIGEPAGSRVFITNVASDNGRHDFQICGQDLPDPVYSVGNSILVRLGSLSNVNSGFNASYEAIDEKLLCPASITLTETSGVITSPFYPRMYPDNQKCGWQITARQGNYVKLEIAITLNIQQCGSQLYECSCDYLQVQHGFSADPNGNKKICGAPGQTKIYYSTHETLKVLFVSDASGSKQYDGFKATYTTYHAACGPTGEFLSGTSGFFTSPNFPNSFIANSNCTWNITVPTGSTIKLSFFNFTLEPNQGSACIGEPQGARVFITNVASDNGRQDFQICGQDLPDPVYSVGNSILVTLRSLSNVYSGFNASYEAIDEELLCPRSITLTETSGVITSPFYPRMYPDNQNCSWQITARQGYRVKLEIAITLNIQQCGSQQYECSCDYLQVQNGFSADPNGNEKICGAPGQTKIYYSTLESLKVQFVSDASGSKQYDGFKATYTQLNYSPPICPTEAIPLSGNGKLSSPNYPMGNYSASMNCSWIITVPSDKQVKFTFTELALGSCEHACSSDNCTYVELYDGASTSSPSLGRFCNGSVLQDVLSSGNQMFVTFRSGSSLDRGFEAQYSVSLTETTPPSTVTASTTSASAPYEVNKNEIEANKALLNLANKEFLSNGNRTSYIQIIVIQLKDEDQDVGTSTDEKYAAKNINKDYETKEEGKAYITAEIDYGKKEFSLGDEKHYSRSKTGSKKYLNGELESNTHYAVFQRSFDDYGSYDSERFIFFKTKKPFPLVTVIVIVLVVVIVVVLLIAVAVYFYVKKKKRIVSSNDTDMVLVNNTHAADLEKQLTTDEKLASKGGDFGNPTYYESVDSAAESGEGGDYEEIKEGSAAKEGHYQELNSNHSPDYEGLNTSQGLETSF